MFSLSPPVPCLRVVHPSSQPDLALCSWLINRPPSSCQSLHVPTAPAPFSLSSTKLSPPLELLSQRARLPSAPLHLSALVHTRYSIRQTNVSQSAKDRLREGKEREEREKRGRKIIQLESDPSKTKGKGKATSSVGGSRTGTPVGRSTSKGDLLHPPGTASSSSSSRQASKSPAPPGSKEGTKTAGGIPLRTRVLQLLALGPLSSKQIASRVRANEGEVSRILDEVGLSLQSQLSFAPLCLMSLSSPNAGRSTDRVQSFPAPTSPPVLPSTRDLLVASVLFNRQEDGHRRLRRGVLRARPSQGCRGTSNGRP